MSILVAWVVIVCVATMPDIVVVIVFDARLTQGRPVEPSIRANSSSRIVVRPRQNMSSCALLMTQFVPHRDGGGGCNY